MMFTCILAIPFHATKHHDLYDKVVPGASDYQFYKVPASACTTNRVVEVVLNASEAHFPRDSMIEANQTAFLLLESGFVIATLTLHVFPNSERNE
ncbi:unnamed protein product [Echinostoma caproni]|uniref:ZP domain-containing protein n=1 Tax=Echinostoma caproni TaxID=27848 RepID=A0A183AG96_9TREM|nr:unnamed protein product [Echinostoma caproni]